MLDGQPRALEHRRVHREAGVVVDVIHELDVAVALAFAIEVGGDLLHQRMVAPAHDVGAALDALGLHRADVVDVGLVEPVHDDELLVGNAVALHLLGRDDVHGREVPADHPIRVEAADLRPHRGLVLARQRVGEELQLKAFLGRQRLQHGDGFLAEGVVGVDEADLHALQVALVLVLDVLHIVGHLAPVGRADGEDPLEDIAVDGVTAADEGLQHDVAVGHGARQHGTRHRRRQEVEHHDAFALELLVALDAALRLVAVVLRHDLDGVAFDAALGVDDVGVVLHRLHDLRRDEGIGLGQVVAQAVLDGLRQRRRAAQQQRQAGEGRVKSAGHGHVSCCGVV